MFVLDFERELPAPSERVFALIADPDLMNRWSEARIERVARGDAGHPGGTGALRRVHTRLGGHAMVLNEVIERSEAPLELRYRVFGSSLVKRHEGVQTISPTPRGAKLRWRVEIDLAHRPLEWVARAALRPALERSLDALVRIACESIPERPLPPHRALDELTEARAVRDDALVCLAAEGRRAEELLERGDDRGWFARAYQHVTELMLRGCDEGRFEHPAWVLRLIGEFHPLWEDSLAIRLGEQDGEVEPHWARAHRAAERAHRDRASTFVRAMRSIHAGMRAHIEDDLPRAIAKVHLSSYLGRADLERFRADYLRMSDVFIEAGTRICEFLPRAGWPLRARALDAMTPSALRAPMMDRTFYPMAKRRQQAFERALGLVRVLSGG